jgi:hypothetical protein
MTSEEGNDEKPRQCSWNPSFDIHRIFQPKTTSGWFPRLKAGERGVCTFPGMNMEGEVMMLVVTWTDTQLPPLDSFALPYLPPALPIFASSSARSISRAHLQNRRCALLSTRFQHKLDRNMRPLGPDHAFAALSDKSWLTRGHVQAVDL